MAGSPHVESAGRRESEMSRALPTAARRVMRALSIGLFRRAHVIEPHQLPAILLLILLVAWTAITLQGAYEEGRECRARGGVIMEVDPRAYDSVVVKLCTADY